MTVKFFGQFLLERGKIIREELLDAMVFQKEVNVKLGTIAMDAGYLKAEQVENIHRRQKNTDLFFGEIAIDMKYLTREELDELLMIQKNEHITLGEALVQKGYLTLAGLAQELDAFRKSQEGVSEKLSQVIKDAPNSHIPEVFLDLTMKMFRRIADLDLQILSTHSNTENVSPNLWNVYQKISGRVEGVFLLSLPENVFLHVSSKIAEEKLREINEFSKDGVKEFVNFIVGNSIAALSQKNIRLDSRPPQIVTSMGQIDIPARCTNVVSLKVGCPVHELENQTLQISVLYSPVSP